MKNWLIVTLISLSVIVALKARENHSNRVARHELLEHSQMTVAQKSDLPPPLPLSILTKDDGPRHLPQEPERLTDNEFSNLSQPGFAALPALDKAISDSNETELESTSSDIAADIDPYEGIQFNELPSTPPSIDDSRGKTSDSSRDAHSPRSLAPGQLNQRLAMSGIIRNPFAIADGPASQSRPPFEPSKIKTELNSPENTAEAHDSPPTIPQLNRDRQDNRWAVTAGSSPSRNETEFDPNLWSKKPAVNDSQASDTDSVEKTDSESPENFSAEAFGTPVEGNNNSDSMDSLLNPESTNKSESIETPPPVNHHEIAAVPSAESQSILSLNTSNEEPLPNSDDFATKQDAELLSHSSASSELSFATSDTFVGGGEFEPVASSAAENRDSALLQNSFQSESISVNRWWREKVTAPILDLENYEAIDVQKVIYLALENSMKIQAISQQPLIAETEIEIARANFDPTLFAKSMYDDRVDPVGNTLTTGGLPFLKDNIWTGTAGLRRKTFSGANVDLEQKLGFQNSNSRFFTPQDQGTAVLSLNFEQPLLRGRGQYINRSQIMLAQTTTDVEWDDFSAKLQNELLEVVNAYWDLYALRASLLQKRSVYERGLQTFKLIEGRQELDTQAIQVAQARAAVRSRETELANAYRDVRNAEIALRRLMGYGVNAANVNVELVTTELPLDADVPWNIEQIAQIALEKRPELKRAIRQTQITAINNQVAANQILPDLSLLFGSYVAALDGGTGIERAWQGQFGSTPGVSAGLSFELPYGNRAAHSRLRQSELEMVQARALVEQATIDITTDVQQAYWRLKSADETFRTASASLEAAQAELEQNVLRWETFALTEGDWSEGQTQSLVLDQLLISQQKLFAAEAITANAEKEMKQSQVFLRRAMGTLIDYVDASRFDLGQTPQSWGPSNHELPPTPDSTTPSTLPAYEHLHPNGNSTPQSEPAPPAFDPTNNQSGAFSNPPANTHVEWSTNSPTPPSNLATTSTGNEFPSNQAQINQAQIPEPTQSARGPNTGLKSLVPAGFRLPKLPSAKGVFHSEQSTESSKQLNGESPFGGFGWQEPIR